jgi:hypothetical protein
MLAKGMNLENIVVVVVFFLYFISGVSHLIKGNFPWALIWFSYSLANLGLIWAFIKK